MNPNDSNNLKFILSIENEKDFRDWYSSLSEDDAQYALEIVKAARTELLLQTAELFDEVIDCTEAMNLLKGYML